MLHTMYQKIEAKSDQAAYYQVLDGYAKGLVNEEEMRNAVSSIPQAESAQPYAVLKPGMVADANGATSTKIVRDALVYIKRHYNENISVADIAEKY